MARILNISFRRLLQIPVTHASLSSSTSSLSSQEISAVLRPLYFAVHPDLFYQFPKEKEINENSLKQLNFYLETVSQNLPVKPVFVTFCLRKTSKKPDNNSSFKQVKIQLLGKDIHRVLHNILSSCHLPTEYLDTLQKPVCVANEEKPQYQAERPKKSDPLHSTWWQEAQKAADEIEERIRNEPDIDLRAWLSSNGPLALGRLERVSPLRQESERLRLQVMRELRLSGLQWECGWGPSHLRGTLLSLRQLALQHPGEAAKLRGRTIVFGRQTGVSFEGHIILSSEDVRNNWLELLRCVEQQEAPLVLIPGAERALSEVLRGVVVCHRKFRQTLTAEGYVRQLAKLTSAIYRYRWMHGLPDAWPRRMDAFRLDVEGEAGPLMLSPTGQFIVPASCPAFLLVDFVSQNMDEAATRTASYHSAKVEEEHLRSLCMQQLGLESLDKDDNVTPDKMAACCGRLLATRLQLRGLRLRVSHYYSVLQDGEVCLPWDWKAT